MGGQCKSAAGTDAPAPSPTRSDQHSTNSTWHLDWACKSQSDYELPQWTCPRPIRISWSSFFLGFLVVMIDLTMWFMWFMWLMWLYSLSTSSLSVVAALNDSDGVSVSVSFHGSNSSNGSI